MNLVTAELTRRSVTLSSAEFFAHLLPPFVALSEFSNFNILPPLDSFLIPLAFHVRPIRTVAVLSPPPSYPSILYDDSSIAFVSPDITHRIGHRFSNMSLTFFFYSFYPLSRQRRLRITSLAPSLSPSADPCHPPNRFHCIMPPLLSSPSDPTFRYLNRQFSAYVGIA